MKKRLSILLFVLCASFVIMPARSADAAEFPAKYRTKEVTSVKDQGRFDLCWAFALTSSMETELIKNNGVKADLDLSEVQIGNAYHALPLDPLGQNTELFTERNDVTAGGNNYTSVAMLGNGVSPIEEKDCPVVYEDVSVDTRLDASLFYTGKYYLKEAVVVSQPTLNQIKEAIMKYGSVVIGIWADETNFNTETNAWYNPDATGTNHSICIVGWDDNYSKKNFLTTPKGNGAWIVKNSYGEDWGDKGFCYISYYDTSILCERNDMLAVDMECGEFADNLYQNAYTVTKFLENKENGDIDWSGYNEVPNKKIANVFTAQANSEGAEALTGISFFTFEEGSYEISIYKNVVESNKPESGTLAATVKGKIENAGYQIVPLNKTVYLSEGETFSIVAQVKNTKGEFCGFAKSTGMPHVRLAQNYQTYVATYVAEDWEEEDIWCDYGALFGQYFYLKAYTDNIDKKDTEEAKRVLVKKISKEAEQMASQGKLPDVVKGLKVAYTDSEYVVLQWDAAEDTAHIIYQYNSVADTWVRIAFVEKGKDYYRVSGLAEGKTYTFGIRAVKADPDDDSLYWQSIECVDASVTTVAEKKITPTVTVTPNGNVIEWTEVSGVTKYVIYVSSPETDYTWKKLKTVAAGATLKYTHKKAIKGLEYQYRVYIYKDDVRLNRGTPVSVLFE